MLNWFLSLIASQVFNVGIQFAIASAGWAAFALERLKSGGTTKVKLRMKTEFTQSYENGKAVVEIELQIVNIGMASVYIEEWGIELRGFRQRRHKVLISDGMIELDPGKPYKESFYYPNKRMMQEASLKDRVYIYVKCRLGQIVYSREKSHYFEFEREYMKVREPSDTTNKEIEKMV